MSETSQPQGAGGYLVSDLIGLALRQIGIGALGTTPSALDISDAVMHLNMMLAKWQQEKFIVPNLVDRFVMSTGASIYYVGPGGSIDMAERPAKIESAYARLATGASFTPAQLGDFLSPDFSPDFFVNTDGLTGAGTSGPIDFPLAVINSYEEYASIGLKGLRTWPSGVFYSPNFPYGELRFWPIPQAGQWELHIVTRQSLPSALTPSSAINLPSEYFDLILWTLAVRLAPSYGQEASPTVAAMARSALATIRAANQQIPRVQMPASFSARGCARGNPWWIYTGGF